jgi:hypothetical protein
MQLADRFGHLLESGAERALKQRFHGRTTIWRVTPAC